MPSSRSELPLRSGVDSASTRSEPAGRVKRKGLFKKVFGGGFDQILQYSQLHQSYKVCGYTFRLMSLFYAAFFSVFMLVSEFTSSNFLF